MQHYVAAELLSWAHPQLVVRFAGTSPAALALGPTWQGCACTVQRPLRLFRLLPPLSVRSHRGRGRASTDGGGGISQLAKIHRSCLLPAYWQPSTLATGDRATHRMGISRPIRGRTLSNPLRVHPSCVSSISRQGKNDQPRGTASTVLGSSDLFRQSLHPYSSSGWFQDPSKPNTRDFDCFGSALASWQVSSTPLERTALVNR